MNDLKDGLDWKAYQDSVAAAAEYVEVGPDGERLVSRDALCSHLLGLCGEVGSLAWDVTHAESVTRRSMNDRLGTELWYIATLATILDIPLESIAGALTGSMPPPLLEDALALVLEMASHVGMLAGHIRTAAFHEVPFDFGYITTELFHVLWRVGRLAPIFTLSMGEIAGANVKHIKLHHSKQGDGHGDGKGDGEGATQGAARGDGQGDEPQGN